MVKLIVFVVWVAVGAVLVFCGCGATVDVERVRVGVPPAKPYASWPLPAGENRESYRDPCKIAD